MAAGSNHPQHFRKAIGALKDSTKVGLAKVNSENKYLDIAIVKATNHLEVPPKEKHVRTIFEALSRPKTDFAYCMQALAKRLAKTSTWTVALKTLIIIHRALREMVPPIYLELISYSQSRVLVLNMSHFKDESTPNAWYYSTWVRYYALYLEERLESLRILNYDVVKESWRTKELDIQDLLEQLPSLQHLLFRLLSCQPEGVTRQNSLIQYTLSIVAAESVHIYVAITAGNRYLVNQFFQMQRHDAVRSLEIYRKATDQAAKLSEFYEICRGLEFGSRQKYIKIDQAPATFLQAMVEYVKEAPQSSAVPHKGKSDGTRTPPRDSVSLALNLRTPLPRSFHLSDDTSTSPRDSAASAPDFRTPLPWSFHHNDETHTPPRYSASSAPDFRTPLPPSFYHLSDSNNVDTTGLDSDFTFSFQTDFKQDTNVGKEVRPTPQDTDLLDLDFTQDSSKMDDGDALAREIANSDDLPSSLKDSHPSSQFSSWELELVATPSTSRGVSLDDCKMASGLDRMTLNSLYDNALTTENHNETQQTEPVAFSPFENAETAQENS